VLRGHRPPLPAGWKRRSPASAEPGPFHLVDQPVGWEVERSLDGSVTTQTSIGRKRRGTTFHQSAEDDRLAGSHLDARPVGLLRGRRRDVTFSQAVHARRLVRRRTPPRRVGVPGDEARQALKKPGGVCRARQVIEGRDLRAWWRRSAAPPDET
jgi:hypothetical protein